MTDDTDIIIVGGGLTGSLAALALAEAGFSIALVDADDPAAKTDSSFDGRTTALAYASVRLIDRLGLWQQIAPHAEAIRDILVTDGRAANRFSKGHVATGFLHFDSREINDGSETPLGYIAENRLLRDVFLKAIEASERIRLIAPAFNHGMTHDARLSSHHPEHGRAPLRKAGRCRRRARLPLARTGRHQVPALDLSADGDCLHCRP